MLLKDLQNAIKTSVDDVRRAANTVRNYPLKQRFKLQPEWRKPLFAVKRQENRHKKILRKHSASFTTYNSWIFQDSAVSAPYWERSFPAS